MSKERIISTKPEGYVNSFPKSGRTWVRYTLAQYFKRMYDIKSEVGFKTLGQVFSDAGDRPRPKEFDEFPNIVFSHMHPLKSQAQAINIMIVRNVLDVMVSYYHHHDANRKMQGTVYQGIMKYELFHQEYVDYMNKWFGDDKNNLIVVHYEKLHDPLVWFDMIEQLGHIGDSELIGEAMIASNFENMQKDELANPQVMKNWSSEPNHMRVRKGKVGGWKDVFKHHEAQDILGLIKGKLNVAAKHALKAHGVIPEL
jgi:alcohol sulfotransferase